ncbi:hypothetical protein AJ79_09839 [Helicocarpus griseus UAMH5409]|uniref:Uncharacterized protein n=1 Tax=Helicocarpus griseus UAMH5409 TaxID=1447875 RepID=A0A2B7WGX8_9EURO|nr:hypothetical protein AJ79_09839 [Helicocarpus griseus UAMH5409]
MVLRIILLTLLLDGIYCLEEMGSVPFNDDNATQGSRLERIPLYAPTPGYERTPSVYYPFPDHGFGEPSTPLCQSEPGRLGFLDEAGFNSGRTYDEDSPTSINYLIEWKVTLNNRLLMKDTEQDLVF